MIAMIHARRNFWLRIREFFACKNAVPLKPKPRTRRTRAFLELP